MVCPITLRESYVGEMGKSKNAEEMAQSCGGGSKKNRVRIPDE
jgi:hypothetical protein